VKGPKKAILIWSGPLPLKIVIRNGIRTPGNKKVWVKCSHVAREEYTSKERSREMKNAILLTVPMVFLLGLFSSCATML
jgi:hypothetical protein